MSMQEIVAEVVAEITGRKLGYARVSTRKQDTGLQRRALTEAGVERIYEDKLSGKKTDRPELNAVLAELRAGDTLYVWKMDRAFRSFSHCIKTIQELDERGIRFVCTTQPEVNTGGAMGRMVMRMLAVFAEFERDLTSERVKAGMANTTKRLGQPTVVTPSRVAAFRSLRQSGMPVAEAARAIGMGRATVYRHPELFEGEPAPAKGRPKGRRQARLVKSA